jgi:hypothetical protein
VKNRSSGGISGFKGEVPNVVFRPEPPFSLGSYRFAPYEDPIDFSGPHGIPFFTRSTDNLRDSFFRAIYRHSRISLGAANSPLLAYLRSCKPLKIIRESIILKGIRQEV